MVNLESLAKEAFEPLRKEHVHRSPLAINIALEKLEDKLSEEFNFNAAKERISEQIEKEEYDKAVYLLNHFFLGDSFPNGIDEKISEELHSLYLKSFVRFNDGTETNKIDSSKAFFNVLLVDDFAFLHIYQMGVLETQFLAGVGPENTLAPVIHFDFECLPQNFEKRLKKKHYDLILMDIDFGKLKPEPAKLIKVSLDQEIPVIMFSKYRDIKDYEKFMGGTIGAIQKDIDEKNLLKYLWEKLQKEYELSSYIYNNKWLLLNSPKLKRIGIYNLENSKDPREIIPDIEDISNKDDVIQTVPNKIEDENKNYELIPFPGERDESLEIFIIARVPSFVRKPKYLRLILDRLEEYGVSYENARTEFRDSPRGQKVEVNRIIVEKPSKQTPLSKLTLFSYPNFLIKLQIDLEYIVIPSFPSLSLLDIIGPVTIGPSSSHTAGANRMARIARNFCLGLKEKGFNIGQIVVEMLNSFYDTGEGHGSDRAIAAGLIGLKQYDEKLPNALKDPGRNKKGNVIDGSISNASNDGKILLNKNDIDVNYCWNKKIDPDIHNNSVKFHIYLDDKRWEGWNEDETNPPSGDFALTLRSWGGGNVQVSGISSPFEIVRIKDEYGEETINASNKVFSDSKLDTNTLFLSGKTDIIIEMKKSDNEEEIEINIKNIFGIDFEAINRKREPVVVESPVQGDIFEAELAEEYKNRYRWITAEETSEKIPRPDFLTLDNLIEIAQRENKLLWRVAFEYESWVWNKIKMRINEDFLFEAFKNYRSLMLESVEKGIQYPETHTDYKNSLASALSFKSKLWGEVPLTPSAVLYSISVNEVNAKMIPYIVAAPTAGACGIIPGVMKAIDDELAQKGYKEIEREKIEVYGLIIAALVGLVINNTVPTSGAKYGCQAETGTGAAMAAAMAAFILGGSAEDCIHAAAIALKNSLGLVCDPLGGRVEVPCIKRSGMKAGEALEAAFLSLRGIRSEVSPSDVVRAMKEIGDNMPSIYKETSRGGLALARRSRTKTE